MTFVCILDRSCLLGSRQSPDPDRSGELDCGWSCIMMHEAIGLFPGAKRRGQVPIVQSEGSERQPQNRVWGVHQRLLQNAFETTSFVPVRMNKTRQQETKEIGKLCSAKFYFEPYQNCHPRGVLFVCTERATKNMPPATSEVPDHSVR